MPKKIEFGRSDQEVTAEHEIRPDTYQLGPNADQEVTAEHRMPAQDARRKDPLAAVAGEINRPDFKLEKHDPGNVGGKAAEVAEVIEPRVEIGEEETHWTKMEEGLRKLENDFRRDSVLSIFWEEVSSDPNPKSRVDRLLDMINAHANQVKKSEATNEETQDRRRLLSRIANALRELLLGAPL